MNSRSKAPRHSDSSFQKFQRTQRKSHSMNVCSTSTSPNSLNLITLTLTRSSSPLTPSSILTYFWSAKKWAKLPCSTASNESRLATSNSQSISYETSRSSYLTASSTMTNRITIYTDKTLCRAKALNSQISNLAQMTSKLKMKISNSMNPRKL